MKSPAKRFVLWKKGVKDGLPIGLGYAAVSFSFGILAAGKGLTAFQGTLMSATNLTSAGQLAALGVMAAAAPYTEMALVQAVINLRYSLMSCALSQKLAPSTPLLHRFVMAAGVTDEIFALSAAVPGRLSPFYTYGLMTAAVPGWSLGTLSGILLGEVLPRRLLSALGVALYGMFIAVVVPPARHSTIIAGLVLAAMGASALASLAPQLAAVSPGLKIIALTLIIAGAAAWFFPIPEKGGCNG